MIFKKAFLFSACIFFINLNAIIVESNTITEIRNHLTHNNTLVVCDLDNTLVETVQELGSDQWFSYIMAKEQQNGKSFQESLDTIIPLYIKVRLSAPLVLIEQDAPSFLRSLQRRRVTVIALTAQNPKLIEKTTQELKKLGIRFSQRKFFNGNKKVSLPLKEKCIYHKGILFASNNDKGKALLSFLDCAHLKPNHIIFVDDKAKNLISVEQAAKEKNITFTGIRYNKLDEKVRTLDIANVDRQLKQFLDKEYTCACA